MSLTNTNAIEKQRPSIADYPSVKSDTPGGREHQQTDKHDSCILDETPSTAQPSLGDIRNCVCLERKINGEKVPVPHKAHQNLTNNNTNYFQVIHGIDPLLIANLMGIPTATEHLLEERLDVSNRKQHITIKTNKEISQNISRILQDKGLTLLGPDQHQGEPYSESNMKWAIMGRS